MHNLIVAQRLAKNFKQPVSKPVASTTDAVIQTAVQSAIKRAVQINKLPEAKELPDITNALAHSGASVEGAKRVLAAIQAHVNGDSVEETELPIPAIL